jgi:hypothetical protein
MICHLAVFFRLKFGEDCNKCAYIAAKTLHRNAGFDSRHYYAAMALGFFVGWVIVACATAPVHALITTPTA